MFENNDIPQAFMSTSDGPTDTFSRLTETLQAHTLASYLFMMVTDYNLQQSTDLMRK